MTATIAVTGKLSGTGKTSLVVNLAATLAEQFNQKVLVIDLTHTSKLLDHFGYARTDFQLTLQELSGDEVMVRDHIVKYTPCLHLLSGREPEKQDVYRQIRTIISAILSAENPSWDEGIEKFIPGAQKARRWLRKLIDDNAVEYDYILFDTSSSTDVWGWCACAVAQLILIPNGLNLREVREITGTIADIGMLTLIYRLEKQGLKVLRHDTARKEKYENPAYKELAAALFLKTQIREAVLLNKKQSEKLPVLTHPDSLLAKDYKKLAIEFMALMSEIEYPTTSVKRPPR